MRSPAYSLNNLNNNNSRDNSLHIFTPQKQTEHQRKDSDLNNNSAGSITFRRINLKSGDIIGVDRSYGDFLRMIYTENKQ